MGLLFVLKELASRSGLAAEAFRAASQFVADMSDKPAGRG